MHKTGQLLLYTTAEWDIIINVVLHEETIRMPQKKMAELFWVDVKTINEHIKNIYKSWELDEQATIRKNQIVQKEAERDVSREINFYHLDMIIAVGYRVNSDKATQFRIRATKVLNEYIRKWFAMDDARLKNGRHFGKDYFDELLERIRDIRASERRFYQKITDIYATAIDYDTHSDVTKIFFATVQNKLHYAISWQTAAEIVYKRADATKETMGLTSWKASPAGKIMKTDITIAKNYLSEQEIKTLNLMVNAYLDIAELQAMSQEPMTMQDRKERLDEFLQLNRKNILEWAGTITAALAKEKAEKEFSIFSPVQDMEYMSDFDAFVQELKKIKK